MDINDFLPLLLKNSNPQMGKMFEGLNGKGGPDMMQALMGQALGGDSKNKEMMALLNMMQSQQKKGAKAMGFKPIYNFVPKDILGIMVKYYNR